MREAGDRQDGPLTAGTAEDGQRVALSGRLDIHGLNRVSDALADVGEAPLCIDLSAVERLDTSIAWAVTRTAAAREARGLETRIEGAAPSVARLLATVRDALPVPEPSAPAPTGLTAQLDQIGRSVVGIGAVLRDIAGVLGLFLARLGQTFVRPAGFRLTALVHHCEDVGWRAVPIVSLMAFLIGVVLAFQGSVQLRQFGAEVFVVDLIAISILRELGILLTAIIVAGRTASAFTAAIGSMKMREEIDAMQTLGIDPGAALVVPRVLALVLMLPILGLIANVSGLFGGLLMSWAELGISPAMFLTRLVEGTDVSHVFVGLVKAPVFAVIIGVIGCQAGLAVGKTAESLGRMTSGAVVAAIFAVILADAVFSVFFAELGI